MTFLHTDTVERIFLIRCFERLDEALPVVVIGDHLFEAHRLVGPANPQHNFQLLIFLLQQVALLECIDQVPVDDQRAVRYLDYADVHVSA